jgi:GNAT superfamily N-acetyltransferase
VETHFRLAIPDDAPLFVALVREGFAGTREYPNPSSALQETEAEVRAALGSGFGLVARVGDRDVGCVRFRIEWAGEPRFDARQAVADAANGGSVGDSPGGRLFFSRLTVLPEMRGHGIASVMVAFLSSLSLHLGIGELAITVRSQQPDNRPYWKQLGFEVTGYSERYGIADMVTHMRRRL